MDREKVITSVVASIVTAAIMSVGAIAFNFFTVQLNPTDIPQVARTFVNDENSRDALLDFMARDSDQRFRGLRGEQGSPGKRGEQGVPGETPLPKLQFINLDSPRDNPASQSITLGQHQFCSLTRVHLPHASQACGCIILQQNAVWRMDLVTDPSARGGCRCTAMCTNW